MTYNMFLKKTQDHVLLNFSVVQNDSKKVSIDDNAIQHHHVDVFETTGHEN